MGEGRGGRCGKGKKLTVIVWISTEKIAEEFSVVGCVAGPHVPDLVTQGVGDEFVFRTFHDIVGADVGGLGIGVVGCVEFLGGKEPEVFAPEEAAECGGVVAGFEGLPVHFAVN